MIASLALEFYQLLAISRPEVTQVFTFRCNRLPDIIVCAAAEISVVNLGDDFAIKPEPSLAPHAQQPLVFAFGQIYPCRRTQKKRV